MGGGGGIHKAKATTFNYNFNEFDHMSMHSVAESKVQNTILWLTLLPQMPSQ